jgi:hypothetical protein
MLTAQLTQKGVKNALLIGLPIGLIFSYLVLYLSLFPPFNVGLFFLGGKIFWQPIVWGGLIPLVFAVSLWAAGRRIEGYFSENSSLLRASFLFTFFINIRLFALISILFIANNLFLEPDAIAPFYGIIIGIGSALLFFMAATIWTTLSIGLLIVWRSR